MRVLETAAGTGMVSRALRDALPATATLTASDFNIPMLDIARQQFRPGEKVEFLEADAQALPFADAAFDAVVCQGSIRGEAACAAGRSSQPRMLRSSTSGVSAAVAWRVIRPGSVALILGKGARPPLDFAPIYPTL